MGRQGSERLILEIVAMNVIVFRSEEDKAIQGIPATTWSAPARV